VRPSCTRQCRHSLNALRSTTGERLATAADTGADAGGRLLASPDVARIQRR